MLRPNHQAEFVIAPALASRVKLVRDRVGTLAKDHASATALHDLRVACRRAEEALELCGDLLPKVLRRDLCRRLRTLRRSCNTGRDADVLQAWLSARVASTDLERWRKTQQLLTAAQRDEIQSAIAAFDFPASTVRRLTRSVEKAESEQTAWHAVVGRWFRALSRFITAWPALENDDPRSLHQLRVATKRARYATELLNGIVAGKAGKKLVAHLAELQSRLGDVQDASVRCSWLAETTDLPPAELAELRAAAADEFQRAITSWLSCWRHSELASLVAETADRFLTRAERPRARRSR